MINIVIRHHYSELMCSVKHCSIHYAHFIFTFKSTYYYVKILIVMRDIICLRS